MISFINYRMEKFDPHIFEDYMRKYFVAQDQLIKAGIYCPGYKTKDRAFWYIFLNNNKFRLFPIVTPNKLLFV
jgi:hypothetical protein